MRRGWFHGEIALDDPDRLTDHDVQMVGVHVRDGALHRLGDRAVVHEPLGCPRELRPHLPDRASDRPALHLGELTDPIFQQGGGDRTSKVAPDVAGRS
jgi:hypothetical protein